MLNGNCNDNNNLDNSMYVKNNKIDYYYKDYVLIYSLSGAIFGYFCFKKIRFIIYCSMLGSFNGLIFCFSAKTFLRNHLEKIDFWNKIINKFL